MTVPEAGARPTEPLESAIGRPGGALARRAVFVAVLICLVAVPGLLPRLDAEGGHPGTEIAVAGSALTAWRADDPRAGSALRAAGVSTVVLGMRTAGAAVRAGEVATVSAADIRKAGLRATLSAHGPGVWLRPGTNATRQTWGSLVAALKSRAAATAGERLKVAAGARPVLRWDTALAWSSVPIGYDLAEAQALVKAGFVVLPALSPRQSVGQGWLDRQVRTIHRIASGNRVLLLAGAPLATQGRNEALVARWAQRHTQVMVGDFLDDADRATLQTLATELPGGVVRVHWVPLAGSATVEALETRGRRAVKERGVRLLAVRVGSPAMSLETAREVLSSWSADLPTAIGAANPAPVTGVAEPLPPVESGMIQRASGLLACFMVVALAVHLLTEVRVHVRGRQWRLFTRPLAAVAYCLLAIGALVVWLVHLHVVLEALLLLAGVAGAWAAVATAGAGLGRPPEPRSGWPATVLRFLAAAAVVVATGTALAAAGAHPVFLLGIDDFRGVKFLLLAPVVATALTSLAVLRVDAPPGGYGAGLSRSGRAALVVAAVAVAAGLVAVYLVRSGNTDAAGHTELMLRDRLDEWLYVRPRFKEVLLGYPALVLALRWRGGIGRFVLLVLAAIGTAGSVDSFAHFHTPFWVSLLRTGYAAGAGLVLGVVLALVIPWLIVQVRSLARQVVEAGEVGT